MIKKIASICFLASIGLYLLYNHHSHLQPKAAASLYSQIRDLRHPTLQDYRRIQEYLAYGERENIERLGDMLPAMRSMKIIGETKKELPEGGTMAVNSKKSEKENCVLVYSSFNKRYPNGLKRLLKAIKRSDFKGHVLYRLGGWPNAEGGDLVLAHVPYAFKVSFFKEAQRLGYKRVLWLDAAVLPLVSLNDIFSTIQEKGVFVMGNGLQIGPYMHPQAAAFFGLTQAETDSIPSCSAGLFGVDFSQEIGRKVIELWDLAAHDKEAFFSMRSDQNALSIILHQLQITDFIPIGRVAHGKDQIKPDSLFLLDRGYVN